MGFRPIMVDVLDGNTNDATRCLEIMFSQAMALIEDSRQ